ncbi:MAG: vitamin B12 dependent methionine synthase, partial [Deltaproteobacteria bacterium]|nr:vitamin B12 dependent methionine synthase [Deltaproteobacteria bacterium]
MDSFVLDNVPFQIDTGQLYKNLRIKEGSELVARLNHLVDEAQAIGRPKAAYKVAFIESRGDDQVIVGGVMLTSRVMRVNLEKAHRVFPYVATCGLELEDWSSTINDMLEKYWADVIKEMALRVAFKHLNEHLIDHFQPGKISRMNPGSLPDWPLPEQQQLFALLGGGPASIGIKLTDSF